MNIFGGGIGRRRACHLGHAFKHGKIVRCKSLPEENKGETE